MISPSVVKAGSRLIRLHALRAEGALVRVGAGLCALLVGALVVSTAILALLAAAVLALKPALGLAAALAAVGAACVALIGGAAVIGARRARARHHRQVRELRRRAAAAREQPAAQRADGAGPTASGSGELPEAITASAAGAFALASLLGVRRSAVLLRVGTDLVALLGAGPAMASAAGALRGVLSSLTGGQKTAGPKTAQPDS